MEATEFENLRKSSNTDEWLCIACTDGKQVVAVSNTSSDNESEKSDKTPITLLDIMQQLNKILEEQKDVKYSLNSCHEQINECNQLLKNQELKIVECVNKIEVLESKNGILQKENEQLKLNLNELEQYSRRNILDIIGVPEARNENVISVVQAVGTAMGFDLQKTMIDACHRIGSIGENQKVRPIIVKFVSRLDKDEFLRKRKVKRNLVVGELVEDIARLGRSDNQIYVNESLTQYNRILFSKAKDFKKQHNVKYLWCRNGKILMRKEDNSRIYEIKTINDLKDVH